MGERRAMDPPLFFQAHVFVCCNRRPDRHIRGSYTTAGSEALRDYMKACAKKLGLVSMRVNGTGCLDRCELGLCIVIDPEGVWYRVRTRADIDRVLETHLVAGRRALELLLPGVEIASSTPRPV